MPVPYRIWGYLLREVALHGALGLLAIGSVFLVRYVLRYLDDFILIGVTVSDVAAVLRCLTAMVLTYTLPIGFLFGVLVGVGRMAADSEILALRSCGVGLGSVLVPILGLALLVSCACGFLQLNLEHRAKRELRDRVLSMTMQGTMIEPRRFREVGDRMIYVRDRDRENRLEGVMISDPTDGERPLLIFAERGEFDWDPERGQVRFRLANGDIHVEPPRDGSSGYRRIAFEGFEYSFPLQRSAGFEPHRLRPKDMSMAELRRVVARADAGGSLDHRAETNPDAYRFQIQRRLALPLAPLIFALVAVPVSLRRSRGARSWGALLCGLLMGLYYVIQTFGEALALDDLLPAALAPWLPNLFFAALGCFVLLRAKHPPDH